MSDNDPRLARRRAYEAVAQVNFAGAQHRTDIGGRALAATPKGR